MRETRRRMNEWMDMRDEEKVGEECIKMN